MENKKCEDCIHRAPVYSSKTEWNRKSIVPESYFCEQLQEVLPSTHECVFESIDL